MSYYKCFCEVRIIIPLADTSYIRDKLRDNHKDCVERKTYVEAQKRKQTNNSVAGILYIVGFSKCSRKRYTCSRVANRNTSVSCSLSVQLHFLNQITS